jgi:hypothetical protein
MLGDLIGETRGKRIVRRVLPEGRVEVTFEDSGKFLGLDVLGFGTYEAEVRPDGTLYGQGQGIVTGKQGDMATWKGIGVGKFVGAAVSYRGAISYYSQSPKLARLNSVATIFEFEVDEAGNTQAKIWEWK